MDQDQDDFGDKALYDEEPDDIPDNAQSGGANTKGAINQGRTKGGNINVSPEDRVAPADREELMDDESAGSEDPNAEPSFPARVNVMIEKHGQGTLQIETTVQDGEIVIDNVYYFKDAALADAKTAELDWKRRNLYEGPPFGNLDEDLQVLLERYLDERGVNTALALWVPEYIDFKEQREYLNWLSSKSSLRPLTFLTRLTMTYRCESVCGCVVEPVERVFFNIFLSIRVIYRPLSTPSDLVIKISAIKNIPLKSDFELIQSVYLSFPPIDTAALCTSSYIQYNPLPSIRTIL